MNNVKFFSLRDGSIKIVKVSQVKRLMPAFFAENTKHPRKRIKPTLAVATRHQRELGFVRSLSGQP